MIKSTDLNIEEVDLYIMLASYLQYSLGRKSYVTKVCANTIERLSLMLSTTHQLGLFLIIQRAMLKDDIVGMECDHQVWCELRDKLKARLEEI